MTDRSSISSFRPAGRGVPWAAVLAMALCLVFEVGVFAMRAHLRDGLGATVATKRAWLTDTARIDDVAIFGDSRAFSIRPQDMADALGRDVRATNYTWPFIGVEAYELMLRAYLAEKPAPRAILVNLMPEFLSLPGKHLDMAGDATRRVRAYTVVPAAPLLRALVDWHDWKTLGDWFAYQAMPPSARYRDRLVPALGSIARGRGVPPLPSYEQEMVADLNTRGGFLLYAEPIATEGDIDRFHRLFAPVKLQDNDALLARFEHFLALARDSHVRVILANQPIPQPILEEYQALGLPAAFHAMVDRWARDYPNLTVLEPSLHALPLDQFGDFGHINRRGDARYREMLRGQLRSQVELEADAADPLADVADAPEAPGAAETSGATEAGQPVAVD